MMPPRSWVYRVSGCWPVGSTLLALTLGAVPTRGQSPAEKPPSSPMPTVYQPVAGDYGPEYLSDTSNSKLQTWGVYWGWVNTYYQGTLFASGWLKETETTLARVTDPVRRVELLVEMNAAGRLVSREWAKDGSVRRINTADLLAWGKRLNAVRQQETGRDAALLATARQIHAEARQKVAARPASK